MKKNTSNLPAWLVFVFGFMALCQASILATNLPDTKFKIGSLKYIGTGQIGGYVDALGYNSKAIKLPTPPDHASAMPLFQAKEVFSPLPVWKQNYFGNSRAYQVKFESQLLIDGNFIIDSIQNYSQQLLPEKGLVITNYHYKGLEIEVTSLGNYAHPRIIQFITRVKNKTRHLHTVQISRNVNDSSARHFMHGAMKPYPSHYGLIVGHYASEFGTVKAACNPGSSLRSILPDSELVDMGLFSAGTENLSADPSTEVLKALTLGCANLLEGHNLKAKSYWQQGLEILGNDSLALVYKLSKYMALGNVGGPYQPMASLLGTGGWSGITYSWDSYFPQMALLKEGFGPLLEPGLKKIIREQLEAAEPFINFGYDLKSYLGAGRYNNELHETAAGPATALLMMEWAQLNKLPGYYRDSLFPVIIKYAIAQSRGFKKGNSGFYKDSVYFDKGQKYILRSLESDRKKSWFTDLAMAYQFFFHEVARQARELNLSNYQTENLDIISDNMFIPQTSSCFAMFDQDNFPNIPYNGWRHRQFSFPGSAVGVYPFPLPTLWPKISHTMDTMYFSDMAKPESHANWGGYPLVSALAAQRLGNIKLLKHLIFNPKMLHFANKINLSSTNSLEDTDSFLMSFSALQILLQESVFWKENNVVHFFPSQNCLVPEIKFKNLAADYGVQISGNCKGNNYSIEIDFKKTAGLVLQLPGIFKVKHNNKNSVLVKKTKTDGLMELTGTAGNTILFVGKF